MPQPVTVTEERSQRIRKRRTHDVEKQARFTEFEAAYTDLRNRDLHREQFDEKQRTRIEQIQPLSALMLLIITVMTVIVVFPVGMYIASIAITAVFVPCTLLLLLCLVVNKVTLLIRSGVVNDASDTVALVLTCLALTATVAGTTVAWQSGIRMAEVFAGMRGAGEAQLALFDALSGFVYFALAVVTTMSVYGSRLDDSH